MIDPSDPHTKPLPQPTRMMFRLNTSLHSIVLDQDLFGQWNVAQSSVRKSTLVDSFDAGTQLMRKIATRLEKQGYRVIRERATA